MGLVRGDYKDSQVLEAAFFFYLYDWKFGNYPFLSPRVKKEIRLIEVKLFQYDKNWIFNEGEKSVLAVFTMLTITVSKKYFIIVISYIAG